MLSQSHKPLLRWVDQTKLGPVEVKNFMLVDGDSQIKSLIASILEPGGWAIHCAPSNAVALEWARSKRFQVILTSEKTSGPADIALLAEVRATNPHTRLIILTGESTPRDVITAMRNHAFSY